VYFNIKGIGTCIFPTIFFFNYFSVMGSVKKYNHPTKT
jgi:hypothetical protein